MSRSSIRARRPNAPPPDVPWAWLTQELLQSPAWSSLPLNARRVVDRILIEHMAHAGTQNGELTVTYDDFVGYGINSRSATSRAIRIAIELGLVDLTLRGHLSYGGARQASRYGLTWLPRRDGTPASNRWRRIKSRGHAEQVIASCSPADPIGDPVNAKAA